MSEECIKPAPASFKTNGYVYVLIRCIGRIAIYASYEGERLEGYEVHILRKKSLPPCYRIKPGDEIYTSYWGVASNREFGRYAWFIKDKETALKRMQELVEAKK